MNCDTSAKSVYRVFDREKEKKDSGGNIDPSFQVFGETKHCVLKKYCSNFRKFVLNRESENMDVAEYGWKMIEISKIWNLWERVNELRKV